VFYHPKERENVRELLSISQRLRAELVIVPRPTGRNLCSLARCVDLEDVKALVSGSTVVVLETTGIDILQVPLHDLCKGPLSIVVGAEDYGVPPQAILSLNPSYVIRLPMSVAGASYNVVSSLVILLTHLEIACSSGS